MDLSVLWRALSPAADWSICALIGGDGETDNPSLLKETLREDKGPAFSLSEEKESDTQKNNPPIAHILSESQIYTTAL